MGQKNERYASRRGTPWDDNATLTPTQAFIARNYEEHYMQRHPMLSETGEVEMIHSHVPEVCPFCGSVKQGYNAINAVTKNAGKLFFPQQELFLTSIKFPSANG